MRYVVVNIIYAFAPYIMYNKLRGKIDEILSRYIESIKDKYGYTVI